MLESSSPVSDKFGGLSVHFGKRGLCESLMLLDKSLNTPRFPPMFTNVGLAGSAGIASALMFGVSIVPTIFLQWKGKALR